MSITLKQAVEIAKEKVAEQNKEYSSKNPLVVHPSWYEYKAGWVVRYGTYVTGTDSRTGKEVTILADMKAGGYTEFITKEGEYQYIAPKTQKNSPIPLPLFPGETPKEIDISEYL